MGQRERLLLLAACVALGLGALGCQTANVRGAGDPAAERAGSGGGGSNGSTGQPPMIALPDASADAPSTAPSPNDKCAEDVHQAERAPVRRLPASALRPAWAAGPDRSRSAPRPRT
jgi:hypothetical protein